MNSILNLKYIDLIGHHTILYGETNTYKTYHTSEFVKFLVDTKEVPPKEISILDFAPLLMEINNFQIGGKIQDFYKMSNICRNIKFKGDNE